MRMLWAEMLLYGCMRLKGQRIGGKEAKEVGGRGGMEDVRKKVWGVCTRDVPVCDIVRVHEF